MKITLDSPGLHHSMWLYHYFAYASNLNEVQMQERKVAWRSRIRAILLNYEVVFNTRSARYEGYSGANIKEKEGSIVEGIAYQLMDQHELEKLDTFEIGYDRKCVEIQLENGLSQIAVVYVAKKEWEQEGLAPQQDYLDCIFSGGKTVFSLEYKRRLERSAGIHPSSRSRAVTNLHAS